MESTPQLEYGREQTRHPWTGTGHLPWWEKLILTLVNLLRLFFKEMWGIVKSGLNTLFRGT
jgi:hypothetical protein